MEHAFLPGVLVINELLLAQPFWGDVLQNQLEFQM